jgi:outer membrane protein W
MKRHIILTVMLLVSLGALYAQDATTSTQGDKPSSFVPEAGDFSGAILFGRGSFLSDDNLIVPNSAGGNRGWTVGGNAPYNYTTDPNYNSVSNIVGAEMRYFATSNIAVKLSGGAIIRNTPSQPNIPGITDADNNAAWIPAYEAVVADNQSDINVNLGGEYHFTTKYNRLSPYAGLTVPFYYGRRSLYDPTINDAVPPTDPGYIVDVGVRHAELVGFGVQAVAGVDYYLMEGFYFGFEIKPISYQYARLEQLPAPGLPSLQSNNTTLSFFSQTFLKIGFRF